jgi:hypothetical protein
MKEVGAAAMAQLFTNRDAKRVGRIRRVPAHGLDHLRSVRPRDPSP